MKSLGCAAVLQILFCDDRAFKYISAGIRKRQTVEETEQSCFSISDYDLNFREK
jgi:hypothetical protein